MTFLLSELVIDSLVSPAGRKRSCSCSWPMLLGFFYVLQL